MSKIKEMLKNILMEFNNLSTDKAELYWEEDSELEVGYKVYVNDPEGNRVPAEDGEYISDENVIKIEGGIVTEIEKKDPADSEKEDDADDTKEEVEAAEEPAEAPAEEPAAEPAEEPETPAEEPAQEEDKTVELEKRIADLEETVAELVSKIAEIASAPAATPVVDEFEKVTKTVSSGDKKLDKRIALASALKQN